jgi:hypothetical protein
MSAQKRVRYYTRRYHMMYISSNWLRLMTLFIAGSILLSSLTGCRVYKDWKQKEETRLMQTTREAIARENAERKAEKEANKNWLQRHWTGVSIASIGTLTAAVVGMAAVMVFKWPQDGKQGIQGPAGAQGVAGKDGIPAELLEQIQKNTADIQQTGANVVNQERALKEVIELARYADATAHHAINSYAAKNQDFNYYYTRLEALENGMRVLHQNASLQ